MFINRLFIIIMSGMGQTLFAQSLFSVQDALLIDSMPYEDVVTYLFNDDWEWIDTSFNRDSVSYNHYVNVSHELKKGEGVLLSFSRVCSGDVVNGDSCSRDRFVYMANPLRYTSYDENYFMIWREELGGMDSFELFSTDTVQMDYVNYQKYIYVSDFYVLKIEQRYKYKGKKRKGRRRRSQKFFFCHLELLIRSAYKKNS